MLEKLISKMKMFETRIFSLDKKIILKIIYTGLLIQFVGFCIFIWSPSLATRYVYLRKNYTCAMMLHFLMAYFGVRIFEELKQRNTHEE